MAMDVILQRHFEERVGRISDPLGQGEGLAERVRLFWFYSVIRQTVIDECTSFFLPGEISWLFLKPVGFSTDSLNHLGEYRLGRERRKIHTSLSITNPVISDPNIVITRPCGSFPSHLDSDPSMYSNLNALIPTP